MSIIIQKDATIYSLFTSANCSTCFGWYLHPSSGAHITVSTVPGIIGTFTATCHERHWMFDCCAFSYKFRIVQKLKQADCYNNTFCNCCCKPAHKGEANPLLTLFTNRAKFYLNGHISTQNNGYQSADNPGLIHAVSLPDIIKVAL